MLYIYRENQLFETNSLIEAAGLSGWIHPVVSAVGAGGKTSVLRQLAGEYAEKGTGAVVTTTTHILKEDLPWFQTEPSEEKLTCILKEWGQVWMGVPCEDGRLGKIPEDFFERICGIGIPILTEADGARMLPLKCPGEAEPVIPEQTTHVLSVYGLDAVGKQLRHVCFRPELAARILKKDITEPVAAEDIGRLAVSEQAGRKGCPGSAVYTVVLNKADNEPRRKYAGEIGAMLEKAGIHHIAVTSLESPANGKEFPLPRRKRNKTGGRKENENTDKRGG